MQQRQYKILDDAIKDFGRSLADGQHIELLLVRNLCKTWGINTDNIDKATLSRAGCAVDHLIQEANYINKSSLAIELNDSEQRKLISGIHGKIVKVLKLEGNFVVDQTLSTVIKEASIKQALIYRDWQQAIGDLMIEKNDGATRFYDVIGYNKFEALYTNGSEEEKKWIKRIERLFTGIDITLIEDRFDSRIAQLKQVQIASKKLINILEEK